MREIGLHVAGWSIQKDSGCAGVQGEGNATCLLVSFGTDWAGLAKKATFLDATGGNPVSRTLTADLLVPLADGSVGYRFPIPPEPMVYAGDCTVVLDGYTDGKRVRSIGVELAVKYAPSAAGAVDPADPTPSQAEQLQKQIDTILGDITAQAGIAVGGAKTAVQKAAEAAESAKTAGTIASSIRTETQDAAARAAESARQAAGQANTAAAWAGNAQYSAGQAGTALSAAQAQANRAQAEADRATVPAVQGVYNVILQDRVTGGRYALVVEHGVLALLAVRETLDATELLLVDTPGGHVYGLVVEQGHLKIEEVS